MAIDTEASLVAREELEIALAEAARLGSAEPVLEWARQVGQEAARKDTGVEDLTASLVKAGTDLASGLSSFATLRAGSQSSALEQVIGAGIGAYLAAGSASHSSRHLASDTRDAALNQELQARVTELTALHRINSAANSSLKLHDMLHETAQAVVEVTRADICTIFLYESDWDQLVLAAYSGEDQSTVGKVSLRLGEGITGWAGMVGKPVAVRDAWEDRRFMYVPSLPEDGAVSILAVPVVLFTKEKLVGVITVHTYEPRDFSENETKFLETVAGEMAIAIENARLYEQTDSRLRQKVAELSTLQGVSAHIAATLNLSEVLTLIAYQSAHLVQADAAAIYELHPDAGLLELVAQYDLLDPNHSIHQGKSFKHTVVLAAESDIAQAITRGLPTPLPGDADERLDLPFTSDEYNSMFCVPLVAPRGIMGAICLYNREEATFSDEQVRLLDAFGHEAAIALENSRLYDAAIRGLRTKSVLLQEMNHRVRNNLQTVAGLLHMQLRRMQPDSKAAQAVRESVARIQSMAVVHDLMTSGDVESTSIYDLARKIADAELSTFSNAEKELKITVEPEEAESIRIGSYEATLLALLLNELLSNAILHGFEGRESGTITIRAWIERETGEQRPNAQVRIEVADDGVGIPDDFDIEKSANLGLNIVHTLVTSDLRGEFSLRPGPAGKGTVALISFRAARST
jgi:two-component sensor histidine kinase/putative methionine-R-sulfoxide reductase with GAF domain